MPIGAQIPMEEDHSLGMHSFFVVVLYGGLRKDNRLLPYFRQKLSILQQVFLQKLLNDLNLKQEKPTILNEENQGAIALSKNPKYHSRTKHIDVGFHFIKEKMKNCEIKLEYCRSEHMVADKLTTLGRIKYKRYRDSMCVRNGL